MNSLVRYRLERQMARRPSTLVGVGPMSRHCVDAAIEVANEHDIPLMLVASRRQIECESLGRGYVEGWSSEEFAAYVQRKDSRGNVILCRDHGGPWQGSNEPAGLAAAMERAKQSYRADIASGFSIIHVDPSVDPSGAKVPVDTVLDRIFELCHYCWQVAQELGRDIVFEIGTEEQSDVSGGFEETERILTEVTRFCRSCDVPLPMFVVVQTGTKVVESRNVGSFPSPFRVPSELPAELQVPMAVDMLRRHGVHMKVHNADYMDDATLSWMPRLGIAAANVAPEFGLLETRTWLTLMMENGARDLADRFIELAKASKKWVKWLAKDSTASEFDRAVLAGHYVFGTSEFRSIGAEAERRLQAVGVSPAAIIHSALKSAILRYCTQFRLLR
jgi:hypothetical protein